MRYIHESEDFIVDCPTVVTLGKFDGIHLGHQKLLEMVKQKAQEYSAQSAAFTFDHIPLSLCPSVNQHFITTNAERRRVMEAAEMDLLIEYPFTEKLMNSEPEDFIREVIVGKLKACCVVVGTDYCFGKERKGNAHLIEELGSKYGYETVILEKEKFEERDISSTYVREELRVGHMETVNMLLGRPYSITGIIARGRQLGRTIDLPTINIYPPMSKLLPPNGVYASATLMEGRSLYGVTNVGTKPTVNQTPEVSVETFLFDFHEDVYGKEVEVQLKHFQRPEMKFEDIESLKKQMNSDAAFAKELFLLE